MKVMEICGLDNTVCEYALSQGYTHVKLGDKVLEVFYCEEFGADWKEVS